MNKLVAVLVLASGVWLPGMARSQESSPVDGEVAKLRAQVEALEARLKEAQEKSQQQVLEAENKFQNERAKLEAAVQDLVERHQRAAKAEADASLKQHRPADGQYKLPQKGTQPEEAAEQEEALLLGIPHQPKADREQFLNDAEMRLGQISREAKQRRVVEQLHSELRATGRHEEADQLLHKARELGFEIQPQAKLPPGKEPLPQTEVSQLPGDPRDKEWSQQHERIAAEIRKLHAAGRHDEGEQLAQKMQLHAQGRHEEVQKEAQKLKQELRHLIDKQHLEQLATEIKELHAQGRHEEAEKLAQELHRRSPDAHGKGSFGPHGGLESAIDQIHHAIGELRGEVQQMRKEMAELKQLLQQQAQRGGPNAGNPFGPGQFVPTPGQPGRAPGFVPPGQPGGAPGFGPAGAANTGLSPTPFGNPYGEPGATNGNVPGAPGPFGPAPQGAFDPFGSGSAAPAPAPAGAADSGQPASPGAAPQSN